MNSKFVVFELGIKKSKADGLLIQLPPESKTAIITTTNKFAAAPVEISKENIKTGKIKHIFY